MNPPGRLAAGTRLLAAAGLLVAAAFAADAAVVRFGQAPLASREAAPRSRPEQATPPPEAAVEPVAGLPLWPAAALVATVLGLAVVAAAVHLARRVPARRTVTRRRVAPRRGGEAAPAGDDASLLAAVDTGLGELAVGADPRSAVIACWIRLEETAATAGVPRYPSDTATDLVLRLLRRHRVDEPALRGLAEVYRLARYAPHDVDDQMPTHAHRALHSLRHSLAAAPDRVTLPEPASPEPT